MPFTFLTQRSLLLSLDCVKSTISCYHGTWYEVVSLDDKQARHSLLALGSIVR